MNTAFYELVNTLKLLFCIKYKCFWSHSIIKSNLSTLGCKKLGHFEAKVYLSDKHSKAINISKQNTKELNE